MKRTVTASAVALAVGVVAVIVSVVGKSEATISAVGTEAFAVSRAQAALGAHASDLATTAADQLTVRTVTVDPNGDSHVR